MVALPAVQQILRRLDGRSSSIQEELQDAAHDIEHLGDRLGVCGGSGGAIHVGIVWRLYDSPTCPICGGRPMTKVVQLPKLLTVPEVAELLQCSRLPAPEAPRRPEEGLMHPTPQRFVRDGQRLALVDSKPAQAKATRRLQTHRVVTPTDLPSALRAVKWLVRQAYEGALNAWRFLGWGSAGLFVLILVYLGLRTLLQALGVR